VRLLLRFIAVTRPLSYARHKNSRRVLVTIVTTWIISLAVSSPIVLGINYTDKRLQHPSVCTFYNADFLIYSSMASFYVPCVIMTVLYVQCVIMTVLYVPCVIMTVLLRPVRHHDRPLRQNISRYPSSRAQEQDRCAVVVLGGGTTSVGRWQRDVATSAADDGRCADLAAARRGDHRPTRRLLERGHRRPAVAAAAPGGQGRR